MNRKKKKQSNNRDKTGGNTLRIIGGEWRGRKLRFPDAPGLRPTPDRIRETLFNWLQGDIHGARCLDLFAGSGALGLEALSRGASEVVFIESAHAVARQLQANLDLLNSDAELVSLINDDALNYLKNTAQQAFDLIFLDPPFRQNLLPEIVTIIRDKKLLTANGLIYLEHEAEAEPDWQDLSLDLIKETKAGQVKSRLLTLS